MDKEPTDFFEIVECIQYSVNNNIPLYDKFADFKSTYPKLFAMLCDTSCDQQMLKKLLKLRKEVISGNVSQEKGDEKFGEIAVEKYVKPLVNNNI